MLALPEKIKITLETLRKDYKFFVSLKKINGKYYLYKQTSVWNKEKKKLKVISIYLGRITEDGVFVKKEVTEVDELENAKALILAHGGKVLLPKIEEGKQIPVMELVPNEIDRRILMTLSMNARASLTFLGKHVGLTASSVFNRVRQLEKRYNLHYMAEINTEKLGYREFLVSIKFSNDAPSREEMIDVFSNEPFLQLAMTTKGDYDVIVYVLAKSNDDLKDIIIRLRDGKLSKYDSIWKGYPIGRDFGFVPLRDNFIEVIKAELLNREYLLLKELNQNGVMEFTEIDKKCNFDEGRSQYSYHKLMEKGILERITIDIRKAPVKYLGLISLLKINGQKFKQDRQKLLTDIIGESHFGTNKYSFVADTVNPDGVVYFLPVFKEGELESAIENLSFSGVNVSNEIVTSILVGKLCYRLFDVTYSLQQQALVRDYKFKKIDRIRYFNPTKRVGLKSF